MNDIRQLLALPELYLQEKVRILLSNAEHIWQTENGKPLQVISIGEWNVHEGPDFRNMALLVDGQIHVGDGEFHKRSSDWLAHAHQRNPSYTCLLLHIVLLNDDDTPYADYTLTLPEEAVRRVLEKETQGEERALQTPLSLLESLQDYAFQRLQRKTAHALDLCRTHGLEEAFLLLAERFLEERMRAKVRPGGLGTVQADLPGQLRSSPMMEFLRELSDERAMPDILPSLRQFIVRQIVREGKATRMEILVNVFLPIALAVCIPERRPLLLAWFWSLPAVNRYGALTRKFPQVEQDFVWKQQGMLEHLFLQKFGKNRISESGRMYAKEMEEARALLAVPKVKFLLTIVER